MIGTDYTGSCKPNYDMIMTMMALWHARNSLTGHNNNSKIQINKALANSSPIYMHLLDSCWNRNVTDYTDKHDRFMRRPTNRYIWLDLHTWETVSQDLLADIWKTPINRRNVAPLWHIILTPSQPVFVLTPNCCPLTENATKQMLYSFV